MSNSNKAYDVITDRILDALDRNILPWRKPWSLQPGMRPQNLEGRSYTGINAIMLGLSGYSDTRWLTYRKTTELGGHIRKGEKSTPIVFWKQVRVKDEKSTGETVEKTIPLLRYFRVFNVEQTDGLELPVIISVIRQFDPLQAAEAILEGMPNRPSIAHDGGDRAYYVPSTDGVHLPPRSAFESAQEFYSTTFHELGHSTGHESRLNRHEFETGIAPFGSEVYSREELAAEFTSTFLCHESGIENTIENSTAYIQGWAKAIRSDKRLVVVAASQGEKAANYILDRQVA